MSCLLIILTPGSRDWVAISVVRRHHHCRLHEEKAAIWIQLYSDYEAANGATNPLIQRIFFSLPVMLWLCLPLLCNVACSTVHRGKEGGDGESQINFYRINTRVVCRWRHLIRIQMEISHFHIGVHEINFARKIFEQISAQIISQQQVESGRKELKFSCISPIVLDNLQKWK